MIDHFGFLAPFYERFIKPKPPEILMRLLELPVEGALLDVGGGTGRVSSFLIDQAGTVILSDLSEKMLHQSQDKNGLEQVCSHAEKLPFPDGSFERLIMVDALHHVCDQGESTQELWRVLKPGGKLIIEEPDIKNWGVKLVALGEKIALMRSHFLSPAEIKDLYQELTDKIQIHIDGHNAWIVVEK
jgi:demethylmenaquinone methyltransferase/2-methoxy-6-polyprenyl-1,4-benzoquinol methylase